MIASRKARQQDLSLACATIVRRRTEEPPTVTMYAALLRAVNVGGRKVPMKDLQALFEERGHEKVATYIQSGNVVFDGKGSAATLAKELSAAIEDSFGLKTPVVLRTKAQLEKVIETNPYAAPGVAGTKLHVVFLADKPTAKAIGTLDPDRSPPDEFTVLGREIYILAPNGVGRSKLTIDWFEKRLGTVGTNRNWNTVNKLLAIMVK
jgi:uncharacterized protein (DUF1697 family)